MKSWKQKYHHFNKIWKDQTITKLKLSSWGSYCESYFSKFGGHDGCRPPLKYTHKSKIGNYTSENSNFQILSSYASSRCGQSSLTGWWVSHVLNSSAIFGACLLWVIAQTTTHSWLLQWSTPMDKKAFLTQVSVRGSNSPWNIILLHIKSKSNRACTYLLETYKIHHAKWDT